MEQNEVLKLSLDIYAMKARMHCCRDHLSLGTEDTTLHVIQYAQQDDLSNEIVTTSTKSSTRMGFEPTRAEPNGLAVHRLNHSATSSWAIETKLWSYSLMC